MQKNISLQTLSLALKADNERLKSDNDRLTQLVTQLGGDPTVTPGSIGSAASSRAGASAGRKRKKVKVEDGDDGSRAARETSIAGSSRHGSRSGSIAGSSYSVGRDEGASNLSPTTVHDQRRASSSSYSPSTSTTTLAQPVLFHPSSGSQNTTPCSSSSPHTHTHRPGHTHPSQPLLTAPNGALSGPSYSPPAFDSCGFCTTNDTPCICRMAAESRDLHSGFSGLLNSSDVSPKQIITPNAPGPGPSSGVDYPASGVSSSAGGDAVSLPSAYLRRRNSGGGPRPPASIWSYSSAPPKLLSPPVLVAAASSGFDSNPAVASTPANSLPECTGDPSACPACADDPFGKAFCETLEGAEDEGTETGEGSIAGTGGCGGEGGVKCTNCQETAVSKASGGSVELSCCGAPEACGAGSGSGACVDVAGGDVGAKKLVLGGGLSHGSSARSASSFAGSEEPESHHAGMISTSTAWRQFKSHPNTTFADLSLLAEVVSRRVPASAGAHGVASPAAASSPGPSSFAHASPAPSYASVKLEEEEHSMFGGGSVPPGSRKRRRAEVEVEGVREALRILDARGKRGPNGEIMLGVMGLGAVGIGSASVAPGVVEVAAGTRGRRMSDLRGTDRAEFGFDQLVEEGTVGGDVSMTAA